MTQGGIILPYYTCVTATKALRSTKPVLPESGLLRGLASRNRLT